MFDLRNFLMVGFRAAVGNLADYRIILNATGWYDKGVLLKEDLTELSNLIGIEYTDPEKEDMQAALDHLGVENIPDEVTDETETDTPVEEEVNADELS